MKKYLIEIFEKLAERVWILYLVVVLSLIFFLTWVLSAPSFVDLKEISKKSSKNSYKPDQVHTTLTNSLAYKDNISQNGMVVKKNENLWIKLSTENTNNQNRLLKKNNKILTNINPIPKKRNQTNKHQFRSDQSKQSEQTKQEREVSKLDQFYFIDNFLENRFSMEAIQEKKGFQGKQELYQQRQKERQKEKIQSRFRLMLKEIAEQNKIFNADERIIIDELKKMNEKK